jgi:hypothetical protein
MVARTAPTIALGPTGNQSGSHYFLSLCHGRVLRLTRWDELPMPHDVTHRVSAIGHLQGMPHTRTFADVCGCDLSDTDLALTMSMMITLSMNRLTMAPLSPIPWMIYQPPTWIILICQPSPWLQEMTKWTKTIIRILDGRRGTQYCRLGHGLDGFK